MAALLLRLLRLESSLAAFHANNCNICNCNSVVDICVYSVLFPCFYSHTATSVASSTTAGCVACTFRIQVFSSSVSVLSSLLLSIHVVFSSWCRQIAFTALPLLIGRVAHGFPVRGVLLCFAFSVQARRLAVLTCQGLSQLCVVSVAVGRTQSLALSLLWHPRLSPRIAFCP